jgi:hypothetical protein
MKITEVQTKYEKLLQIEDEKGLLVNLLFLL